MGVERVALAGRPNPRLRPFLYRASDDGLDQLVRLRFAQRRELQTPGARVLPQRRDRVGARLPPAHGGEHEGSTGLRQLEHERGRRRVEQMRIVDSDDQGPPIGEIAQRIDTTPEQLELVIRPDLRRNQARERAERNAGGGARRLHPGGPRPVALSLRERGASEPGLPDAGRRMNHHAGQPLRPRSSDQLEFILTTDQRPKPLRNQEPMR